MSIDLTSVIVALVGGFFSIATLVVGAWINARMKDQQAAATLSAAIKNSLGIIQQVAGGQIQAIHPTVELTGLSPAKASGVQYVLDHAGDEAARFGITQEAIAEKITAQIGLQATAADVAAAGASVVSPAPVIPLRTADAPTAPTIARAPMRGPSNVTP